MPNGGDRLRDPEYINWLRATLSLMYMKEGLEEFTDNQSDNFHKQLLKCLGNATHSCKNNCNSVNIKKDFRNQRWHMTCSVCDSWLQKAISYHRNAPFPNLSPANTHPNLWHTDSWEIMKLFLPFGCEPDISSKDADIQGILSLFINCKHFSTGRHIGRKDLMDKLLSIRNSLLHSANFKVSEADVKNYFQTIVSFMQGMTGLAGSEKDAMLSAIDKVQQLEANQIEISVNRDLEIRALQERQVALDRDLRALVDVTKKEQDNQSAEVKQNADRIKELTAAKHKLDEFLEENDILLDVSKLSTRMGDLETTSIQHATRISTLEDQIQSHTDAHTCDADDLEEQCTVLQQHLIRTYRKRKFWENPVSSEEVFLSEMYVQPSVEFAREIDHQGMLEEIEAQRCSKLSYKEIFLFKNIYITGDAGKGKTTFCQQLFLNWCDAVQNIKKDTVYPDHRDVLACFRFLFHINLRDSESTYNVEDMIQEQLLVNAPTPINVSDILKTEKCLIVMDGLDEWTCPDKVKKCPEINKHIPGRNTSFENCIFLTTSRNWKYDVIDLKNKDVDKHVELSGIDEESLAILARKIIDYLDKKSKTVTPSNGLDDFLTIVSEKKLEKLLTVPVLLIQLITLWHAGKDFGNIQVQLYCNILELYFERAQKKLHEENCKCSSTAVATAKILPECFNTKDNCQIYTELLHSLAKLAFKSLFNKQKEDSLVFKSSRLEFFGISSSDIKLCLHCGILAQCKDYGNYTGQYKRFSFIHKKVQEFLAALYLVTNDEIEDSLKNVQELCNSVEAMLEMDQVWLFLAGMDRDRTKWMLEHLGHVVSTDERVNTYRHTLDMEFDSLIVNIQRCVSEWVSEGINNGHHYENVCLQDFYISSYNIDMDTVKQLLLCSDMSKVKSVQINTDGLNATVCVSTTGTFKKCHSIQKLALRHSVSYLIPDSTVAALIDNNSASLTFLTLISRIIATDKLVTAICSTTSKSLMALKLCEVKLTHKHKEQILYSLSQSPVIRQLELMWLYCTDHGWQCRPKIDWSAMTHLQNFTMRSMYVDSLQSLPHCVEKVALSMIILPVTSLCDFARRLSETKSKVTVEIDDVKFIENREDCGDLEGFLKNCPGLKLTQCEYNDCFSDESDNSWSIYFDTNSQ